MYLVTAFVDHRKVDFCSRQSWQMTVRNKSNQCKYLLQPAYCDLQGPISRRKPGNRQQSGSVSGAGSPPPTLLMASVIQVSATVYSQTNRDVLHLNLTDILWELSEDLDHSCVLERRRRHRVKCPNSLRCPAVIGTLLVLT